MILLHKGAILPSLRLLASVTQKRLDNSCFFANLNGTASSFALEVKIALPTQIGGNKVRPPRVGNR